jgi:hypothetical protein
MLSQFDVFTSWVFLWRHVPALVWRKTFPYIPRYQEYAHTFLSPKQLALSIKANKNTPSSGFVQHLNGIPSHTINTHPQYLPHYR